MMKKWCISAEKKDDKWGQLTAWYNPNKTEEMKAVTRETAPDERKGLPTDLIDEATWETLGLLSEVYSLSVWVDERIDMVEHPENW